MTPTGVECVSAYIAHDGKVVGSQCSRIEVRPKGANSTYPPTQTAGNPAGFHITIDLGSSKVLEIDVLTQRSTIDSTVYRHWTGKLEGGFQGSETWEGVALYEEFALFP